MSNVIRCSIELEEIGGRREIFFGSLAVDQGDERIYQLPVSASDVTIDVTPPAGTFYVKAFYLTTDETITWRLASGDDENTLTANGCVLLFNCSFTALVLKNAAGATANVRILTWGGA
jgi:hypothetical protein